MDGTNLTVRSIAELLRMHDAGHDLRNADLERLLHYYKAKWESCRCQCDCGQDHGPKSTLPSVPLRIV